MVEVINALYSFPVVTAKQISEITSVPTTTVNRYLNLLVENRILFTDNKKKNRTYYYADLLEIIRS